MKVEFYALGFGIVLIAVCVVTAVFLSEVALPALLAWNEGRAR